MTKPKKAAAAAKKKAPPWHSINAFWLIVIPLLTYFVYNAVTDFGLVNWDDKRYVQETPIVQGLTMSNIESMFTTKVLKSYNPLVLMTFAVDYEMSGLEPGWSHGVNLLFHVMNAILVFICMKKLNIRIEIAGIIALLFGVHPMSTEAVAWIAGRKDVVYGFFFLLSWICYLNYFNRKSNIQYALSILLFICALFSKVQAITLPAVLIVSDYMLSGKWHWKMLINKLPFIFLSAVFGFIAVSGSNLVADKYFIPPTFTEKIIYSVMAFGLYFQKLLLPFYQSAIYSFPQSGSGEFYLLLTKGIAVIALMVWVTVYSLRRAAKVAGGLIIFSALLFVILHIVAVNSALIYERFTYLAGIGLFISVLHFDQLFPAWKKNIVIAGSLAVLLFGILTLNRVQIWSGPEEMWTDVIEKNPRASEAFNNRGMIYFERNDYDKAFTDFNECIKLRPNQPNAYNNRSIIYFNRKDYTKALADNKKVLELDPTHKDGVTNRAIFFFNMEQYDSSIHHYNNVLKQMPNNASAYYFSGVASHRLGRYREAADKYLRAIELNNNYADAYAWLGMSYVRLGEKDSAMRCIRSAENININSVARKLVADEYVALGNVAFDKGDENGALSYYYTAVEIMPQHAEACYSIGGVNLTRRNIEGAKAWWRKALEADPEHKAAREWLQKIGG